MIPNSFLWGRPTNPDNWDFFKAKMEEVKKSKCAITFTMDFINNTFSPVIDLRGEIGYSSKEMFIRHCIANGFVFKDNIISVTVYP